jgi:hypothetical protein
MGNKYAITKLIQVLNDSNEDPMVRHEAGLKINKNYYHTIQYLLFQVKH